MATLKEITHDSSTTLSDFYGTINDPDGAITVTPGAALGGSTNGLNIDHDAGVNSFDIADSFVNVTPTEARFRVRVDLGGLTNSSSSAFFVDFETDGGGFTDSRIKMEIYGDGATGFEVFGSAKQDAVPFIRQTARYALPSSGDVCIEVSSTKETADGNNDGTLELFIDGVSKESITNIQNFNDFDFDTISVFFDSPAAISGTYKCDEFLLTDVSGTSLCAAALTLATMTKPADVDASGEFIYVALLEGGTPILTKISIALDADGVTVFSPGAGDNIGVECSRSNADVVWVAGNFDGTNVIEKSEDGGSTFTIKDDGAIGDVRTFVLGPDSDDRVLIFDETNGDILETRDDGASWDTINAAITPEVNAIARLGENVQESVFGNDGGANDNVNYSVNSGADLEDFNLPVNENVTRVIVN
jgi:hypothetical protein